MKKFLNRRIVFPVIAVCLFFTATSFKNDFFEIAKQIEIFTTLFKELNMNYVDETNPAELMDGAIKEMLSNLDPYTVYMNEQDVEEYKMKNTGEYSGIGAVVRSYRDKLLIVEPYKGYPADEAGLKAGDEILKIGDVRIADFKDNAGELLQGAVNSSVDITYKRQGKTHQTTLTRKEIDVDAVPFYGKINDDTGYIVLSRFNRKASGQTREALEDLESQGIKQLVLDLRGNPGGLLTEAIDVTNLFVPKGEAIVTTKSKVKKFNQEFRTRKKPVDTEIPLVVLINGRSASASEIVSGALQDLDRAVVVGARSFGKGLVQRPLKLTYGTQLKVTISRYYTPSGRCIQALDYAHRDENGHAVRTDASQYNAFKTRKGRTVYDGGGITPDLEVKTLKQNKIIRELLTNHVIFDYATNYYYTRKVDDLQSFSFTDNDYEDFKKFVVQSGFNYETEVEMLLKKAAGNKEMELLGTQVQQDYQKLLKDIEKSKITALDNYKKELSKEIEDEIIKRYFYREGLYSYYLSHDEAIVAASGLLKDRAKYESLLK
ncbi:S41 family peptidase [Sinomicrobium weinanense]|uniref:S41 family peptidase n=1 Tax=Sinomicrobium weinanense TaxID=2842200 RepID=A0A926JNY3_9FLAO|nr:S41 family peptidase [Sinomicrobium weinanense]MBC9794586.1 S41 family peptidase [Sinomicrobium weinanense]MBU3124071.1 S41 family peptidase [Sinomicrobium weinanense]